MSNDAYSLVEGLLEYCGIEGEGFREDGRLLMTVDSEMAIFIVAEDGMVHLSAVLDEAPERPDLYLRLLTENFRNVGDSQYYRYALEPDSKSLVICLSLRSARLTQAKFIDYFKLLLEHVERWTRALYLDNADFMAPERPDEAAPPRPEQAEQDRAFLRI